MSVFSRTLRRACRAFVPALGAVLLASCGGGGGGGIADTTAAPLGQEVGTLPITRHCGFTTDVWQAYFKGEFALNLIQTAPINALRSCDVPIVAGQPMALDAMLRFDGGPTTWAFACFMPDAATQVVQGLPSPNLKNLEGWYCFGLWGKATTYAPAPAGLVLQAASDIKIQFNQKGTVLTPGKVVMVGENEFYWDQYQATYFTRTALQATIPGVQVE